MQMSIKHHYTLQFTYQELRVVCKALTQTLKEDEQNKALTLGTAILERHCKENGQHSDVVNGALLRAKELGAKE